MSFVYSIDIAKLCLELIEYENYNDVIYQSYNICFDEIITQENLLEYIKNSLPSEIKCNRFETNTEVSAPSFYPSVDCGPISNQKAIKYLSWKPSKIQDAIFETVNFFLNAKNKFTEEE